MGTLRDDSHPDLFVPKGTPEDVRAKIEAAAKTALETEAAQNLSQETGVLIYWKDATESAAQIEADIKVNGQIGDLLE